MILAGTIDPRKKLVFVDKMRSNTSLSPQYAYSPKGRRAYAKVLRNHGRTLRCLRVRAWRGARFVCLVWKAIQPPQPPRLTSKKVFALV